MLRCVWVVQDRESGQFLCPYMGDVGLCVLLTQAGRFYSLDEALETGHDFLEQDAIVISFWENS